MTKRLIDGPLVRAARRIEGPDGLPDREVRDQWVAALLDKQRMHTDQWSVVQWLAQVVDADLQAPKKNMCVTGPRRSGKSRIAETLVALMIWRDQFVVRILTPVLSAPTVNFLERAGDGGVVGILRQIGAMSHAHIVRRAGSVIAIEFPWGSALHVHDVGTEHAIERKHGFTAHVFWADEAQYIRHLRMIIANLVVPTLPDTGGVMLFTGTPGDQLGTLYHQMAIGSDDSYEVRRFRSWNNPHFGTSPIQRWHRILDTSVALGRAQYSLTQEDMAKLRSLSVAELNAISDSEEPEHLREWVASLDAEFLRQIFGRWVLDAAAHVYSWHRIAPALLYYAAVPGYEQDGLAPTSTMAERVALLPLQGSWQQPFRWRAAIAVDIGSWPDPWACAVIAWCDQHPVAYEVWSEKEYRLSDGEMLAKLRVVVSTAREAGLAVTGVVADASGMREGTKVEWDRDLTARFDGLDAGVRAPRKRAGYKEHRRRAINLDIEHGRFRCVSGSPLDIEGRHLRYMHSQPELGPAKVDKHRVVHLADGRAIRPGNDCCDCVLYAAEDVGVLLADEAAPPKSLTRLEQRYQQMTE